MAAPRDGYHAEWNKFEQAEGDILPYPVGHPKFGEGFCQTLIRHEKTFPPPAPGITTTDEQISEHVKVRVYQPCQLVEGNPTRVALPLVVFYHGGGWCSGNLDSEDYHCRKICGDAGIIVVSVEYRLGHANKYPVLIEDCYEGFQWAYANASKLGADPNRYLIWGGSAGGALVISVTHKLVQNNEGHKLTGLISMGSSAIHRHAIPKQYAHLHTTFETNRDVPFVTGDMANAVFGLLGAAPPYDEVSKHYFPQSMGVEGVRGFPPTWIVNCEFEYMRDDGAVLKAELRDAGERVQRVVFKGMPHYHWCFPLPKASDEFRRGLVEGIRWLLDVDSQISEDTVT